MESMPKEDTEEKLILHYDALSGTGNEQQLTGCG